uniref:Methyltransferase-like protein 13 (inferred by orthology to a human protein) n=1 Tax=Strongyloides venezuelensis TaxID=75913 RepID=A0A0K0FLB1_STRVS
MNKKICFYTTFIITLVITLYHFHQDIINDENNFSGVSYDEKNVKTVDKLCSVTFQNTCYTIVDRYLEDGVVERSVVLNEDFRFMETSVQLIKPEGSDFWNSDTKLWKVNHSYIEGDYITILAAMPFAIRAIPTSFNTKGNLLEIGLGGGSLSMFLHTKYKNLNLTISEIEEKMIIIARKYFDVPYDKQNFHIKHEDGIKTIKNAVTSNDIFDIIILDACGTDDIIPCPSQPFITDDILNKVKNILKPTGILGINLLITNEENIYYFKHYMRKFLEKFPTCIYAYSEIELNYIVGCMKYSISNLEESEKLFQKNYEEIIDQWNLPLFLKEIKMKLINKSRLETIY